MQNDLDSNNNVIVFDAVSKVYQPGSEIALHDVSFAVREGEFVCLIGPSGCGKTTALKIIAGIEKESSGVVVRPEKISMVFQSGALLPWLTALQNVALGLRINHVPEHIVQKESLKHLEMVKLHDLVNKYPRELSGGQRQRVGIARALAMNPSVLLLDEPFSALDPKTTEELHQDLITIWKETKKTIVMVSHLIEEAVSLGDRVVLMNNFSIKKIFSIALSRPRRENEVEFSREVSQIRRSFFS
ncbi:MAG: ABC transporter ATP-binding protein [Parcubacteria group bacterium]|nr:ABC transporter ATP-binding protein [Parcubacteria group bacterium]